jgi:hypothetical protein
VKLTAAQIPAHTAETLTPDAYAALLGAIAKAYADSIIIEVDTEEEVAAADEEAYHRRELDFLASVAVPLSVLKQLLAEVRFLPYENFHPTHSLESLMKRFGDLPCVFGRENSPVIFLQGVSDTVHLTKKVGACNELSRQQDGTVRVWWD